MASRRLFIYIVGDITVLCRRSFLDYHPVATENWLVKSVEKADIVNVYYIFKNLAPFETLTFCSFSKKSCFDTKTTLIEISYAEA